MLIDSPGFFIPCMIVVIETGGKQYTVQVGDVITVEKLGGNENESIVFSHVLLTSDKGKTEIGTPFLDTAVEGKILSHGRGDKIRVFKMKPKKRYQKTQGHRQSYTEVEITKIGVKKPKKAATKTATAVKKAPTKKAPAKKPAAKKAEK